MLQLVAWTLVVAPACAAAHGCSGRSAAARVESGLLSISSAAWAPTCSLSNVRTSSAVGRLALLRLRGGSQQVFIKTLSGKTVTVDVEEGDTIADVKAKIQVPTARPPFTKCA
jgi:hypothetical protein